LVARGDRKQTAKNEALLRKGSKGADHQIKLLQNRPLLLSFDLQLTFFKKMLPNNEKFFGRKWTKRSTGARPKLTEKTDFRGRNREGRLTISLAHFLAVGFEFTEEFGR
jgi:hypothetical protein